MKKKLSAGLALLVALAVGAGAAFALPQSCVLAYLYGPNSEQTAEQQEAVKAVNLVHTNAGVSTCVQDAVFNGETLSVGITFATEQQTYIVTDEITVNGVPLQPETSSLEDRWTCGNPLRGAVSCDTAFGFSGTLDESASTAEVMVSLTLLTPQTRLCAIDTYGEDQKAMWRKIDASVAAGETPVDQYEPYPVLVGSAWFGEDFNTDSPAQYPLNAAQACRDYSNMRVIDTVDLSFTVSMEK